MLYVHFHGQDSYPGMCLENELNDMFCNVSILRPVWAKLIP